MQRNAVTWVDACIGLTALFDFFSGARMNPATVHQGWFVPERLSMEEEGCRFLRGIPAHLNQGGANQVGQAKGVLTVVSSQARG